MTSKDHSHDPVTGPSHYRGASGRQSIDITHAWRLGPDLTQAVDYILRAGRKTPDPRQDLAKAAFYLRFAAGWGRDLTFGFPLRLDLSAATVADDFALDAHRAAAIACLLRVHPTAADCRAAAGHVEAAIAACAGTGDPITTEGP